MYNLYAFDGLSNGCFGLIPRKIAPALAQRKRGSLQIGLHKMVKRVVDYFILLSQCHKSSGVV